MTNFYIALLDIQKVPKLYNSEANAIFSVIGIPTY